MGNLKGIEAVTWLGLLAPGGTPAPVVEDLNKEGVSILKDPEVAKRLAAKGFVPNIVPRALPFLSGCTGKKLHLQTVFVMYPIQGQ